MIAIALAQVLMSYKRRLAAGCASAAWSRPSGLPPTTVATGIVTYSTIVAGFVMLGAKLNQRYAARSPSSASWSACSAPPSW